MYFQQQQVCLMADEKQHLVAATEKRSNFNSSSITTADTWKHKLGLIALLSLQFCHLTTDSFLIPFYPAEALSKNLTQTHIGLVYSAYEFTRFISAPIFGSLVGLISRIRSNRDCCICTCITISPVSKLNPSQRWDQKCQLLSLVFLILGLQMAENV